jgi:hypothetical protein
MNAWRFSRLVLALTSMLALLAFTLSPPPAWSADGTWSSLPANGPLLLQGSAYDPVRHRMLTFGGIGSGNAVNSDLYALTLTGTPTWSLLSTNVSHPAARSRASIAYDSVRDRLILYGGFSAGGTWFTDVWAYSLGGNGTWSQLFPGGTSPLTGYDQRAIYDPVRDRLLVVGGDALVWALPFSGGAFNWSFITLGGTAPTMFFGFSAVYDPTGDRIITFGGHDELDCPPHFDGCTCNIFGCPTHCFPYCNFRVLAKYDLSGGSANIWQILNPTGAQPDWRAYHSAVFDSQRGQMVVFGGQIFGHALYDADVWRLSLSGSPTWTQLTTIGPAVPPRSMQSAVYDPTGDRLVMNGGLDSLMLYSDTWALGFDTTPPAAVTDLFASGGCTKIQLTWTAPGDDGMTGTATMYDVLRSTAPIGPGSGGTVIAELTPSGPGGTPEVYYDEVGKCSPRYYYAVHARDDVGNWADWGNSPWGKTACPHPPAQCFDDFGSSVAAVPEAGLTLLPAHNPVQDRLSLSLGIPHRLDRQDFDLGVFDLNGRRLVTLGSGQTAFGTSDVNWDLRTSDGARVQPGVYFVRLRVGTERLTRTIVTLP